MSGDNSEQAPLKPAGRNPIERLLVWGGILLLAAFAVFEYFAQQNYTAGIDWLANNDGAVEADVDTNLASAAVGEKVYNEKSAKTAVKSYTKTYKWMSLVKSYQATVDFDEVDGEGKMSGFQTLADEQELSQEVELEFAEGIETMRTGFDPPAAPDATPTDSPDTDAPEADADN